MFVVTHAFVEILLVTLRGLFRKAVFATTLALIALRAVEDAVTAAIAVEDAATAAIAVEDAATAAIAVECESKYTSFPRGM